MQLDPLGTPPPGAAELKPEFHGITEADLAEIPASALADAHTSTELTGTAADVVQQLRDLYCGTIGYEFEHLERGGGARLVPRDDRRRGRSTAPLTARREAARAPAPHRGRRPRALPRPGVS